MSVSPVLFERLNGYPNTFWGWGGEDNELEQRLCRVADRSHVEGARQPVYIAPARGRLLDLELDQPVTLREKLRNRVKELQKDERLASSATTWTRDGVKQALHESVVGEMHVTSSGSLQTGNLVMRLQVLLSDTAHPPPPTKGADEAPRV